jgi:hypothetical protein
MCVIETRCAENGENHYLWSEYNVFRLFTHVRSKLAHRGGRAYLNVRLCKLACWDGGFESRAVNMDSAFCECYVWCKVEASATG